MKNNWLTRFLGSTLLLAMMGCTTMPTPIADRIEESLEQQSLDSDLIQDLTPVAQEIREELKLAFVTTTLTPEEIKTTVETVYSILPNFERELIEATQPLLTMDITENHSGLEVSAISTTNAMLEVTMIRVKNAIGNFKKDMHVFSSDEIETFTDFIRTLLELDSINYHTPILEDDKSFSVEYVREVLTDIENKVNEFRKGLEEHNDYVKWIQSRQDIIDTLTPSRVLPSNELHRTASVMNPFIGKMTPVGYFLEEHQK